MKKNKKLMQSVVNYYEASKSSMQKQAEYIDKLESQQKTYQEKVAEYVDECVSRGALPAHLSSAMKINLSDPSNFVELMSKSGSFLDINNQNTTPSMGSSSDFPSSSGQDALSAWVYNE